jgi:hypothetical protein
VTAPAPTQAARKAAPAAVQVATAGTCFVISVTLCRVFWKASTLCSHRLPKLFPLHCFCGNLILCSTNAAPIPSIPTPLSHAEQLSQAKRGRRLARYEAVMRLLADGVSQSEIARRLGVGRRTVRRWMRVGSFPERAPVNRRSALDRFVGYAEQRYQDGCHNAAQLWRELREQGFRGNHGTVRKWMHHLRPKPTRVRAGPLPTADQRLPDLPAKQPGCPSSNSPGERRCKNSNTVLASSPALISRSAQISPQTSLNGSGRLRHRAAAGNSLGSFPRRRYLCHRECASGK